MNARLSRRIAGQRTAKKIKLHVNSLLVPVRERPHGREAIAASRRLHLAKTQCV
jgi:hypothetical protein